MQVDLRESPTSQNKNHINDLLHEKFSISGEKELTIGRVDTVLISKGGSVNTNYAAFYDAGGKNNDYESNENYVLTFMPETKGKAIEADFVSFTVEPDPSCDYDYLKIYDGSNTSATLVGKYCGTSSPGKVTATNSEGALTFQFYSDSYVVDAGWEAIIKSVGAVVVENYTVTFSVKQENNEAIENVAVTFNSETINTDASGIAVFNEVHSATHMAYSLSKEGFVDQSGNVDVEDADKTVDVQMALATGVDNIAKDDVNIYPNPSQGVFNIDIPNGLDSEKYTIKIYDILGSVVYAKSFVATTHVHEQVDISEKTKGIYFISVETQANTIINRKILVK